MELQSDYSYIMKKDIAGLYNKHLRYINYYAKKLAKNPSDKEDIKQDLTVEMLNLLEWIKPEKLNENFDIKYYLFQKFNAYRKSQKNVKQNLHNTNYSIEASEDQSSYLNTKIRTKGSNSIHKAYLIDHDFPENKLDNKVDRQIYFSKFVHGFKMKDICSDLNMNYTNLIKRVAYIENKLRNYLAI